MLIYTVEKNDKTIGIFESSIDLLLFLYLHQGEFGFDDRGEDLYTNLRGGESSSTLNRYLTNVNVKTWNSGRDSYDLDPEKRNKDVRTIAEKLPDQTWNVTMTDDTKYVVTAPLMPLAVEKAHTEHIFDTNAYSGVKDIQKI